MALAVNRGHCIDAVATVGADILMRFVHQGLVKYKQIALRGAWWANVDSILDPTVAVREGDKGQ